MCAIDCNQYYRLARQIADAECELEDLLRNTVLTRPYLHQKALQHLQQRGDTRAYAILQEIASVILEEITPIPIKQKEVLPSPSIVGQICGETNELPVRGR